MLSCSKNLNRPAFCPFMINSAASSLQSQPHPSMSSASTSLFPRRLRLASALPSLACQNPLFMAAGAICVIFRCGGHLYKLQCVSARKEWRFFLTWPPLVPTRTLLKRCFVGSPKQVKPGIPVLSTLGLSSMREPNLVVVVSLGHFQPPCAAQDAKWLQAGLLAFKHAVLFRRLVGESQDSTSVLGQVSR